MPFRLSDIYAVSRRHPTDADLDQPLGEVVAEGIAQARAVAARQFGGWPADYAVKYVCTRTVREGEVEV